MADQKGRFVWYELMASDTDAAKNFYTKVVGWGTQDGPVPGMATPCSPPDRCRSAG